MTSPVERSTQPPTPTGATKQSPGSPAGVAGASATAGAAAGQASRRQADRRDLQRKINVVARQAPMLGWAAGLRDDETTTIVVTDLAGGWIPPNVKLPPGVSLLHPAQHRPNMTTTDLLGAVVAAVTHHPNGYLSEPGPDDPVPGAGERARYGQQIDELRPTLIDAVHRCEGLPRIVQTVTRALVRKSGVADNEVDLFRRMVADIQVQALSAYPGNGAETVTDWMLLAAIDALIDGHEELARYHLAWHQTVAARHEGPVP